MKKKKLLCLSVTAVAIVSTLCYYGIVSKASNIEEELSIVEVEEENNYIIIADNTNEYDSIVGEFKEDIVDNTTDYLEDNQLLVVCAKHGTSLVGESPTTGIYRQV